jgi:hypothetical protein
MLKDGLSEDSGESASEYFKPQGKGNETKGDIF